LVCSSQSPCQNTMVEYEAPATWDAADQKLQGHIRAHEVCEHFFQGIKFSDLSYAV
jgi:hypothetical protein